MPLITIGITCFNAEKTISNALDSALHQDWYNFEIIIVDDASTDASKGILESFKKSHDKVEVIFNQNNIGVAACRNNIIDTANGEYIAFFDDDDISLPNRISHQYERVINYQKLFNISKPIICHTARIQKHIDGWQEYIATMGTALDSVAPHGPDVAQRILFGKPIRYGFGACATCSQMGFTKDYRALGGFDESLRRSEDTEYNVRFALNGGHFVGIETPLVIQNMTLTSDKHLDMEQELMLKLIEKYRDFIDENDSFAFCREWLKVKYLFLSGHNSDFVKSFIKLLLAFPAKSMKRILWSFPAISQNLQFRRFHAGK